MGPKEEKNWLLFGEEPGNSPNKPHAFPRYRIKRGSQILCDLYGVCCREYKGVLEMDPKFGDYTHYPSVFCDGRLTD